MLNFFKMFSQKIKNISLISLHSFFVILAVYLIVPLFLKIEYVDSYLSIFIATYVIFSIIIRIIKDIYHKNFPQFLFFFIAFVFYYYSILASNYFIFSFKYLLNPTSIYLNSFFTIYLFVDFLIFKNLTVEKKQQQHFKSILKWNYVVIIFLMIFIIIFAIAFKNNYYFIDIIEYSASFIFAVNLFFNKKLIYLLQKNTEILLNQIDLKISFSQIVQFNTIKTFAFSRFGFIGKQEYELSNIEHRKTLRKNSVLNIAVSISKLWNIKFYETFIKTNTNISELEFTIIEKTEEGIIVENENYGRLIFGYYSFISKYIDERNTHNLYLIKNELTIAKFRIKEKIKADNVEIADIFNKYGNTVLINDNEIIEFSTHISVFDKIYNCKNIKEEKNILQKLNAKAKTAFFTNNNNKINEQELTFIVEENVKYNDNSIYIQNKKIENLISVSNLIDKRINISFLIFILQNLFLLTFTVFFYKQPTFVLALSISLSVIYILLFKYLPIKFKIIN